MIDCTALDHVATLRKMCDVHLQFLIQIVYSQHERYFIQMFTHLHEQDKSNTFLAETTAM